MIKQFLMLSIPLADLYHCLLFRSGQSLWDMNDVSNVRSWFITNNHHFVFASVSFPFSHWNVNFYEYQIISFNTLWKKIPWHGFILAFVWNRERPAWNRDFVFFLWGIFFCWKRQNLVFMQTKSAPAAPQKTATNRDLEQGQSHA